MLYEIVDNDVNAEITEEAIRTALRARLTNRALIEFAGRVPALISRPENLRNYIADRVPNRNDNVPAAPTDPTNRAEGTR